MQGPGGRPAQMEKGFPRHPLYKKGVFATRAPGQSQPQGIGANRHGRFNAFSGFSALDDKDSIQGQEDQTNLDESKTHALLGVESTNVLENTSLLSSSSSEESTSTSGVFDSLRRCFRHLCYSRKIGERSVIFKNPNQGHLQYSHDRDHALGHSHDDGASNYSFRDEAIMSSSSSPDLSLNHYDPSSRSRKLSSITSLTRKKQSKKAITTEPIGPYPANVVRNQKYSIITFLPIFLYNEFRFFFNMYFLLVALSQFIAVLRVGFLFTYVAPLVLVLIISMAKEIYDDLLRFNRDRIANNELFNVLREDGSLVQTPSRSLKVGDLLVLQQNERVPCDCVLMRTLDKQGSAFIRTDQLDGETDWKIRKAIPATQGLPSDADLFTMNAKLVVEAPRMDIYQFLGTFTYYDSDANLTGAGIKSTSQNPSRTHSRTHSEADFSHSDQEQELPKSSSTSTLDTIIHRSFNSSSFNPTQDPFEKKNPVIEPLSLDHAVWGNTVVASASVVLCVIYTGADSRSAMNASTPQTKTGLVDQDVNQLSKVLFVVTMILAFTMTAMNGFGYANWYIYMFRMVLLFSSIIPISLRVNLDMGKLLYSNFIEKDSAIPDTIVRTSTIPEELGRISYVFTDKTGTLTRNVMKFKTLQLAPPVGFTSEYLNVMFLYLQESYAKDPFHNQQITLDNLGSNNLSLMNSNSLALMDNQSVPSTSSTSSRTATGFRFVTTASMFDEVDQDTFEIDDDEDGHHDVISPSLAKSGDDFDGTDGTTGPGHSITIQSHGTIVPRDKYAVFTTKEAQKDYIKQKTVHVAADGSFLNYKKQRVRQNMEQDPEDLAGTPLVSLKVAKPNSSNSNSNGTGLLIDPLSLSQSQSQTQVITAKTYEERERLQKQFDALGSYASLVSTLTRDALVAIAVCNNVTPVVGEDGQVEYQASSPDEVALVQFASSVGLHLTDRDSTSVTISTPIGSIERFTVLQIFPFSSETKRMGIIVRSELTNIITFYVKGAESVMLTKIIPSDWIAEEVANLARIGLRTLVFAKKVLSESEYNSLSNALYTARASMTNREVAVAHVLEQTETRMTLIGLTGVEDRLQDNVRTSLELLRNAGVKVWMLTGDKAETAACIGISARLIDRGQTLYNLECSNRSEAASRLDRFSTLPTNSCLMIDGTSLSIVLEYFPDEFITLASQAPAVICCRCSPTQKADVVKRVRAQSGKRTLAIGDGGNDVAMIQAADVGVGIVGKEGKQASMAADFSITQFSFIVRLMLWHGRNSFKRSARLALFVMHRGLIISIMQCVFSALFFFVAVPVYTGWLMVGYTTIFTMLPVFSQVLDEDVDERTAFLFPELYTDLQLGRPLSLKRFLGWVLLSIYQGGLIIVLSMILFEDSFVNIVGITFSALIFCELANVALSITRWRPMMVWSLFLSLVAYVIALYTLRSYFDVTFIFSWNFLWKVSAITAVVTLPPATLLWLAEKYNPAAHTKVDV